LFNTNFFKKQTQLTKQFFSLPHLCCCQHSTLITFKYFIIMLIFMQSQNMAHIKNILECKTAIWCNENSNIKHIRQRHQKCELVKYQLLPRKEMKQLWSISCLYRFGQKHFMGSFFFESMVSSKTLTIATQFLRVSC
jgi:hypothetical protein